MDGPAWFSAFEFIGNGTSMGSSIWLISFDCFFSEMTSGGWWLVCEFGFSIFDLLERLEKALCPPSPFSISFRFRPYCFGTTCLLQLLFYWNCLSDARSGIFGLNYPLIGVDI